MSDVSRSERTTTEVVYTVKAAYPFGADWNQVQQAINAAVRDYSNLNGDDRLKAPADNAIHVRPLDDRIEIAFEKPHGDGLLHEQSRRPEDLNVRSTPGPPWDGS